MATTVTINKTNLSCKTVALDRGDDLKWHNNSGATVTLGLPAIFAPPGNPTIDNGDTSRKYTVKANAKKGNHTYSISTPGAVPRNGTIDVT